MKFLVSVIVGLALAVSASAGVYTNVFGHVVTTADGVTATVAVPSGNAAAAAYGSTYAQNVTNGQAVTLVADTVNVLNGIGSANGRTNTLTIANQAAANLGKTLWVVVKSTSSNSIAFSKTAPYVGPAISLLAGQGTYMLVGATNVLYGK